MSTNPVQLDFSKFTPLDSGPPADAAAATGQAATNLRQSVAYGVQQNPDEYAKLLKQQQVTGMSPQVSAPLWGETQNAIEVEGLSPERMVVSHPRTAGWATNPDNASVAGADELHRLTRIEQHAATMRAYEPTWEDKISDAAQSAYTFLGGSGSLKQRVFQYPLARLGIGTLRGIEEFSGNMGSFAGIQGDNPAGLNVLQRAARTLEPFNFGEQETDTDKLATAVGPMVLATIASGGTSLLARALGLSETAAKVLGGLSVGGLFTADQGGRTFNAMREQGASEYDARLAANRVAAINTPANALFGVTDLAPFLRNNPLLTSLGLGGAQGLSGQLAQNVVTGEPWYRDMPTAALQGAAMQGGMHMGMGFLDSVHATSEEVEQSKLQTRAPEKFQEALQAHFEGDSSLRIPAQEFVNYFAGKEIDPAAMANRLGVSNLTEAAAAGSDLEIPKADFFAKLEPEHQKGLLQDIVDPATEMTGRQAAAGRAELEEWIRSGGPEKLQAEYAQADAETQAAPEWKQVYGELKQRYVDAGESETAADSYATLQANAISNLAKRAGLKADELLALHNPNVVAGEAPGALYQSPVPEGGVDGETGKETALHTPSSRIPAAYRLVEADSLIASHDASTFERNPAYPEGVQERAYDASKEAQARVIQQAQSYEPAYTVNTNPDAVNGPPVITPEGVVLGGNSRTMATQRLYAEGGDVYRDYLKRNAAAFGFTPEQVEAMQKPVLVRQIAAPEGTESLRRLGSELNKSMTGALGVAERAVSAGKNITPETLRWVADALNTDDSTLREMMASHGNELVRRMVQDGVITERERPQFVDPSTGGLSEEGKTFVERALLGTVLHDPRLMDAAPKSVLQKLERSLGAITSFASREDKWNIAAAIRAAVGELGSIQRAGSTVELRLGQASLFGGERNSVVDALVRKLDGKPTEVKSAFEDFARDADENLPGQARMFGGGEPFDAFNHAFGSKLSEKEYHDGLSELGSAGTGTEREDAQRAAAPPDDEGVSERAAGAGGEPTLDREGGMGVLPEPAEAVHPGAAGAGGREVLGEPRGWFRVLPDGRYEIGKTKLGDFSAFVHEPAHSYLELFRELTQREGASDELKSDFKKITEWLGTTPEEAHKNGFTRAQHEQWAKANEQYVREGQAPTSGLQRAFRNFSVWLGSIYRRASALGVEMTSDIRGVMDRLYAGDTAVERAEQEAGRRPLFENAEEAGWTEEEYRKYARGMGMEEMEARKLILGEMRDAAQRERTQDWREEKSNVRDAVTAELDARPEYAAIRSLRRGKLDLGTDLTLNREALAKQFGEERVKALQDLHRGLYRNEGGTDAETAAEMLGYGSGEEMMRALEKTPRRAAAIEQAVRDSMTARHGDIRYDGSLDDKARLAVENDEHSKNMHRELTALRKRVAMLEQRAADAKAAMRAITVEPLEHYQEAARQMIEQKSIADLQPYRYLNASRIFSREAFDALRKGDVKRAADAKNKELLNHFLFREASAARDYADKFESYAKRVQSRGIQQRLGLADENAKNAGGVGDYREQFNWLMARYRLGPAPRAPERSLRAWADDVYGQGNEVAIAAGILDGDRDRFVDYRNAPLSEVRDLHDALVNIRHLALQQFKMFVQGKQVEFAAAKQGMIEAARTNLKVKPEVTFEENRSAADKVVGAEQWTDSYLGRMERWIEWLDGGRTGPWHDHLWNLASDAQGDEYGLQEKVTKIVTDGLADMPAEMRRRLWTEKVSVEGIPEPLARRRMLSIAFNMGNEGNLDRLKKTFSDKGWDPAAINRIGGILTREEWGFVQKAWDSLKPLGVRMQELEKRLTGLPPAMVEVKPFKVALDDGTELDLAGGYYPIVMDPKHSQRAIEQDSRESAQNAMQKGYVRATTSKGYTKARTGYGGQLLLDYEQVLTSHVAKVSKDLSHREFMLASQRLLLDTEVRKALRETLGHAREQQFMPWLRNIINDNNGSVQERADTVKALMQKSRSNFVASALGFNPATVLLQISHAPKMFLYARSASLAQSLVDFLAHPVDATREIRALSPNEMRFRGDNLDRDIRAVLQQPDYKSGYARKVAVAARFGLQLMDHLLSHTLWRAAYRDGLGKYVDLPIDEAQKKAVYEADSAVRLGLGSQAPKDLPAIMRNNEFNKFITTLYGFHNGVYSQLRDIGHQFRYDRNVGKATVAGILTVVVPAVLGSLLTGRGPKDKENPGWWAAKRALLFSADTVPVLRAAASAMERGGDVQFSPLEAVMTKGVKAAMDATSSKEEKDWLGIGLNAGDVAGSLLGIPGSHEAVRITRYTKRVHEGKVKNPNPWNAIVGGGY